MSKTTVPRPLESAVQRECLAICERLDIACFRRNIFPLKSGKHFYMAGTPGQADLWGWLPGESERPGIHWECEVKRPGETPTYDQVIWLRTSNEVTGASFWVDDPGMFRTIIEYLCDGMKIVYPNCDYIAGTEYRVKVPGTRKTRVIRGPSFEYDLVF